MLSLSGCRLKGRPNGGEEEVDGSGYGTRDWMNELVDQPGGREEGEGEGGRKELQLVADSIEPEKF